jgi:hypothetical protein
METQRRIAISSIAQVIMETQRRVAISSIARMRFTYPEQVGIDAFHVSCVMCPVSCALCHVPCVMCHVSCVMWHVPCVMCHVPNTFSCFLLPIAPVATTIMLPSETNKDFYKRIQNLAVHGHKNTWVLYYYARATACQEHNHLKQISPNR